MIATSIQVATVKVLHCVRAIRYQAKSEQNVRQDLIPRVRHAEAALMPPWGNIGHTHVMYTRFEHTFLMSGPVMDQSPTA